MMIEIIELLKSLPASLRILSITLLAVMAHFLVRGIRRLSQWLLSLQLGVSDPKTEKIVKRYPKIVTISTILVSALTFTIYFMAVGLILQEFKISLTAYLASASVIGLAIGFGSQGFVQDVVIGLTLIFSDSLDIGDVVELSGQVGQVDKIGLRFTTLINLHGQLIYIPNRNISTIGQFRGGCIRAYVDIQIPDNIDEKSVTEKIHSIGLGMHKQHKSIILTPPEIFGIKEIKEGNWRYLRIKFRIWPGQNELIEKSFKQRVILVMKQLYQEYADWMITITYKVE
jgi:small conductance mechanosensitive channel